MPAAREQIALSAGARPHRGRRRRFLRSTNLPDADLFALGQILHDWSEAKIALLLRRIFDRLPRGGGLLIAERLLNEDGVGPVAANMQSFNMLVCTEGKERSAGEYERLLRAAGFTRSRCPPHRYAARRRAGSEVAQAPFACAAGP